jgi:uncharacterized protein (TIRG00374 family)
VGAVVRIAVAAGLTLLVLWKSDPSVVLAAALRADPRGILIACALVILDRALMAYRWLVLLRPLPAGTRPPFLEVMRVFFVSTFVGTFLPASVGGDAVRAFALARLRVPAAFSIASVFMDRMLGVLSLLIMAVPGLFLARQLAENVLIQASLVGIMAICIVSALVVFNERTAALARRFVERVPAARLQRAGHALVEAVQRYASHHRALANVLLGSIGVQVLRVIQAYFLGRALHIEAPLTVYFAFIPLILLVMLLPVTINGLGTSQAAFVWSFALAQVPAPEAFALSVLFVALGVVGNLPGGLMYATGGMCSKRNGEIST